MLSPSLPRALVALVALVPWLGCTRRDAPDDGGPEPDDTSGSPSDSAPQSTPQDRSPLDRALDEAFRIAPSQIDVVYDFDPDLEDLDGQVELRFAMRPGQTRALFHFDPWVRRGTALDTLSSLSLDGEALDPHSEADLRVVRFDGSTQDALEIQRELDPEQEHVLTASWTIPNVSAVLHPGWLQTLVDDTVGHGNEKLWPTINSPEAMARHTVEIRVHGGRQTVMVGSGAVSEREEGDVQVWSLDTGRPVASYTVMLAVVPSEDVTVESFDAGGVPVTLASVFDAEQTAIGVDRTREVLGRLAADFGPFPMPSMQILLVDWTDGMEYYGATTTGPSSLSHELVHMYWGCSAVERTWRDTWFDEAVNVWWEYHDELPQLPDGFSSDIVGGRTPIELGFDSRAYAQGAAIVAEMAEALGGDEPMVAFLADLHARRAFAPFTTEDLTEDLVAATGDEGLREDIARWLYTP